MPGSAFDITTGTDLSTVGGRADVWAYLAKSQVRCLVISPPHMLYTKLPTITRVSKRPFAEKEKETRSLLEFAMALCRHQHAMGRYFIFEHPAHATSWAEPCVDSVKSLRGVTLSRFDKCRFGLRLRRGDAPVKKPTMFMSNMVGIQHTFHRKLCNCTERHAQVESSSVTRTGLDDAMLRAILYDLRFPCGCYTSELCTCDDMSQGFEMSQGF